MDLSEFANVAARVVAEDGRRWSELEVEYQAHGHEAYLLLSDIADMMQESRMPFEAAVRSALNTFADLLAPAGRMSTEQQTGLYGELLFLEACLLTPTGNGIVDAWKGFARHEHDFVFASASYEVKTTRAERRRHRIGGVEQLQRSPNADLWLISIQLTLGSRDSGRTLGQVVDDVRAAIGVENEIFENGLARSGWRDRDRALYPEPLTLRSKPSAYKVDGDFPALTRPTIESCPHSEMIIDVGYTIDVTSLVPSRPPWPVIRFVEGSS